jgi:hypothetical protein
MPDWRYLEESILLIELTVYLALAFGIYSVAVTWVSTRKPNED